MTDLGAPVPDLVLVKHGVPGVIFGIFDLRMALAVDYMAKIHARHELHVAEVQEGIRGIPRLQHPDEIVDAVCGDGVGIGDPVIPKRAFAALVLAGVQRLHIAALGAEAEAELRAGHIIELGNVVEFEHVARVGRHVGGDAHCAILALGALKLEVLDVQVAGDEAHDGRAHVILRRGKVQIAPRRVCVIIVAFRIEQLHFRDLAQTALRGVIHNIYKDVAPLGDRNGVGAVAVQIDENVAPVRIDRAVDSGRPGRVTVKIGAEHGNAALRALLDPEDEPFAPERDIDGIGVQLHAVAVLLAYCPCACHDP